MGTGENPRLPDWGPSPDDREDDHTPAVRGHRKKPLPWHPLPYMDEYLLNLVADGLSLSYVNNVKLGLSHFATWCNSEGIRHPDAIERQHILLFQAHLMTAISSETNALLKPAYRQQLMKHTRSWINWCAEIGYIDTNPWFRIRVGHTAKKPMPLEDEEVERLFATHRQQAFSIPPFYYHRREVILMLLYGWGLRIHELQALNVDQMDASLDWVTARNKGGTQKALPYGDEMKTYVMRYLTHRGKFATADDEALLIDQYGKRLSTAMIRKVVVECGQRAGIRINPHRLRDTFGTVMLDNDVEVERIMKMMGHRRRSQTMAYARLNDAKVKESHDRVMTPLLDKLLGGSFQEEEAKRIGLIDDAD